jgi:hypothetical protein
MPQGGHAGGGELVVARLPAVAGETDEVRGQVGRSDGRLVEDLGELAGDLVELGQEDSL